MRDWAWGVLHPQVTIVIEADADRDGNPPCPVRGSHEQRIAEVAVVPVLPITGTGKSRASRL